MTKEALKHLLELQDINYKILKINNTTTYILKKLNHKYHLLCILQPTKLQINIAHITIDNIVFKHKAIEIRNAEIKKYLREKQEFLQDMIDFSLGLHDINTTISITDIINYYNM